MDHFPDRFTASTVNARRVLCHDICPRSLDAKPSSERINRSSQRCTLLPDILLYIGRDSGNREKNTGDFCRRRYRSMRERRSLPSGFLGSPCDSAGPTREFAAANDRPTRSTIHGTKSTAIRHAILASVNLVLGWAKEGKKGARFSGHEVHNFQRKLNKGAVRS